MWKLHGGFPDGSTGKEFTCRAGDMDSIPGSGRSPGGRNGNPLQYSCLENPMDRGAWWATVHGVTKSWILLKWLHTKQNCNLPEHMSKIIHPIYEWKGIKSLSPHSPWGHKESDTTEQLHFHFSLSCVGEGNGNPLQCSCLENPRDGGAWWAAVYGVAQSRSRLTLLSSSSSSSRTHHSRFCFFFFFFNFIPALWKFIPSSH